MPRRRKVPSKEAALSRTLLDESVRLGRALTSEEVDAYAKRLQRIKPKPTSGVKLHGKVKSGSNRRA
jgi:hypothetical protein